MRRVSGLITDLPVPTNSWPEIAKEGSETTQSAPHYLAGWKLDGELIEIDAGNGAWCRLRSARGCPISITAENIEFRLHWKQTFEKS
jgi:hypothetical protein